MNIIIKLLGFRTGNHLKTFVKEKVEEFFWQFDDISRVNLILRKQVSNDPCYNIFRGIRLLVPGNDHVVKKGSEGFAGQYHNMGTFGSRY